MTSHRDANSPITFVENALVDNIAGEGRRRRAGTRVSEHASGCATGADGRTAALPK
jgi:hypothetical protein